MAEEDFDFQGVEEVSVGWEWLPQKRCVFCTKSVKPLKNSSLLVAPFPVSDLVVFFQPGMFCALHKRE